MFTEMCIIRNNILRLYAKLTAEVAKKRGNLFDVIRFSNVHSWLKSKGGAVSPCMTRWQWNQCA